MDDSARFLSASVAMPTLVELQADPSVMDRLPLEGLVALRRQLHGLAADVEQEVTARMLAGFQGDSGLGAVTVLTPTRLAELWSMPVAKIRQLCRSGRIPAKKLGGKEWVVPVEALREWAKQGIVDGAGPSHNSVHANHRGAVVGTRPHAVEIRRPPQPTRAPEGA